MAHDQYESPLCSRYSSDGMKRIFSDDFKFTTWRKLWIALAESERELGLPITEAQIAELRAAESDIDYQREAQLEAQLRHDVMAHIRTYGEKCPTAAGIIHLGATSSFVGDNTDIIRMREALALIRRQLVAAVRALADFAERYADTPCLAFTHFQAAQPTTVGKRATVWIYELLLDLERLDTEAERLRFFGCRGATGTAASFLELFEGDGDKVRELEKRIAGKLGFSRIVPVSGQTYSRKLDYNVLSVLSGIAQSAAKFATDVRLLAHMKEADEPFGKSQVGSSAMAYKRNPMRSERICSLARYVMTDALNPALTASSQWLERTLDDSANRRISLSEAFLATDAILSLYINVASGLVIYPGVMTKHLNEELPFMATENILMYCVKHKGGDRQALHEAIRAHSQAAAETVKVRGGDCDLIERIMADPAFGLTEEELKALLDPAAFIGLAPQQTRIFLEDYVRPVLESCTEPAGAAEITV